jgi:hypothetical protein
VARDCFERIGERPVLAVVSLSRLPLIAAGLRC